MTDAKRLIELLDERAARGPAEHAAAEFGKPEWAPRPDAEIVADIQAELDA